MTHEYICDTSDRELWLLKRASLGCVTASEAYLLFEECYRINKHTGKPFATIEDLKNKLCGVADLSDVRSTAAVMGMICEGAMLEGLRQLCDIDVTPSQKLFKSKELPLACTPDAWGVQRATRKRKHWRTEMPEFNERLLIECKWLAEERDAERFAGGVIPPEYFIQIQTQLAVMGHPTGCLAVCFGGQYFALWLVREDKAWQAEIANRAKRLLDSLGEEFEINAETPLQEKR